jgi:hypothetical protein
MSKTCATCRHSFTGILSKVEEQRGAPKYARCRVSGFNERSEDSLCAVMRQRACGPDADLWEARHGQA